MTHDELIAALRTEHPQWRIWASDEGRLYATRYGLQPEMPGRGPLWTAAPSPGWTR